VFSLNYSVLFSSNAANRKIKFVEFLRIMASLIMDEDSREHGLDTVRVFDPEERGYISSTELETALKCVPGSVQMKDFELREILRMADPDKDGKIDIQGTVITSCKSHRIHEQVVAFINSRQHPTGPV